MSFTQQQLRDAIAEMENKNRHGEPYQWPADNDFGQFERAWDAFMFQLEQVPPFTWAKSFLNWLSTKLT